uniref:Uncharacterized protein n=1 Tax=Cannabis sativa TaxID=3483 RepID=A0A803QS90_CANSA
MGSTEKGEGSIGNRRGRKPKGKEKKRSVRKFSGVETRSGRKKTIALDELEYPVNLSNILANCVEIPITYEQNFGGGEEAAATMPPPIWVFNDMLLKPLKLDSKLKLTWKILGVSSVFMAPHIRHRRTLQWLTKKVADCHSPWVVMGDLNVILNDSEKAGGRRYSRNEGELLDNFLFETGGVDLRKLKELQKQLGRIQNEPMNDNNIKREAELQLEILSTEEIMNRIWKQKSREGWLRFGDDNTKFFHKSTLIHRRRNFIGCVKDDAGEWVRDRVGIGKYFHDKFQALFKTTSDLTGHELDSLFFDKVSALDNEEIGQVPSGDEVRDTVFKMHPPKAPGPDGYP